MTQRLYQPSFAGGELSPALGARTDLAKYSTGLARCRNFLVHRTGGVSNRPGFEYLGNVADEAVCPTLIAFRFNNTTQVCLLEWGDHTMRVWFQGALVTDAAGAVLVVPTPYSAAQAATMGHAQSGDVMYLAHAELAPRKLSRNSWTSWSFEVLDFVPTMATPTGLVATLSGNVNNYSVAITYKISAISAATGEESLACAYVGVTGPTADDWPVGTKVVLTWTSDDDVAYWRVYKGDNGIFGYIGLAGTAHFDDTNITADVSDTEPKAENPFAAAGDYPSVVAVHQQRLVWAATTNAPNGLWFSRTGFYQNMSASQVVKADDAIAATLGSGEINAITGLISVQDLIIFTTGSENICNGGTSGSAITASASGMVVKPQSYWGSGNLMPLVSGNTCLFIQGLGSAVRDLFYDYSVDGFVGNDRSVLARHLVDGHSITSWAYAQTPDSTFWLVRDDGALLSLTYFREQDVGAWALHTTNGAFERVAVVEGDDRHEVFAVIKRSINGTTRRFVERLGDRRIATIKDAAFLDAHMVYDGDPVSTLTGLNHLAGEVVGVLADGNVESDVTVSATGTVTLPRAHAHVVVGLRYDADTYIRTLPVDLGMINGAGTVQGRKMSVAALTVRVQDSREFRAGPDLDHLTLVKPQTSVWDDSPDLASTDVTVTLAPTWGGRGQVALAPNGPVPLTVLAVMPELVVGT